MNYLAHLFLSCNRNEVMCGNFLCDMLTMKEQDLLPAGVMDGIKLHRIIDNYTDEHPLVKKAKKMVASIQGKYAAVTVDIYFDYFLSKNWNKYSDEPIENFESRCYSILNSQIDTMPTRVRPKTERMIQGQFLKSCTNYYNLGRTFHIVANRAKFDNFFHLATLQLIENEEQLNELFNEFFPDLVGRVNTFCREIM